MLEYRNVQHHHDYYFTEQTGYIALGFGANVTK